MDATKIVKEELQAAKGELQAAEIKLEAAEIKLEEAVNAWANHPTDDIMKGILLNKVENYSKQVESNNKQVGSWGERVSEILKQISSLESKAAPTGSTRDSLLACVPAAPCCSALRVKT
jgi:hypothetical protein